MGSGSGSVIRIKNDLISPLRAHLVFLMSEFWVRGNFLNFVQRFVRQMFIYSLSIRFPPFVEKCCHFLTDCHSVQIKAKFPVIECAKILVGINYIYFLTFDNSLEGLEWCWSSKVNGHVFCWGVPSHLSCLVWLKFVWAVESNWSNLSVDQTSRPLRGDGLSLVLNELWRECNLTSIRSN